MSKSQATADCSCELTDELNRRSVRPIGIRPMAITADIRSTTDDIRPMATVAGIRPIRSFDGSGIIGSFDAAGAGRDGFGP